MINYSFNIDNDRFLIGGPSPSRFLRDVLYSGNQQKRLSEQIAPEGQEAS